MDHHHQPSSDRLQPQSSDSSSQNLSSQVSTLTLSINHRDCVNRDSRSNASTADDSNSSVAENGRSSSSIGGSDADSDDFITDPSASGLREQQTPSNSNMNCNTLLKVSAFDSKGFQKDTNSVASTEPLLDSPALDKENVGFEDLLRDFYTCLYDLHFGALEELIFQHNIDVNLEFHSKLCFIKRKHFGWRPIHIAASRGSAKFIEFLLQQGSDLNLLTPDGDTALHIAAKNGAADVVQSLLEHDVFLRDRPNNQGITALLKAIYNSKQAFKGSYHRCVDLLLAAGCNPNISTSSLVTALHVAVDKGDHYLVQRVINAGANVNALCDHKSSPLLRALIANHVNTDIVMNLLLAQAQTNLKMSNGRSLLHIAVSRCDDRIVERFMQHGADCNFQDVSGKTPLWVAVEENNIKVVPMLVRGGADINYVRQPQCISVLSQAVINNSLPMVKLLLEMGASAYTETFMWSTPLHEAVDQQNADIVRELLRANCALNTSSNAKFALKPMTPIQLAMELGNLDIIALLIRSGARVNRLWLRRDRMSPSLVGQPEVVSNIEGYLQEVPPLLHLSRLELREFLGERFRSVVSQMSAHSIIPSKFVDYLCLKDILD